MSAYVDDSMDIPIASNRIWYEVDIDYESGYRNNSHDIIVEIVNGDTRIEIK